MISFVLVLSVITIISNIIWLSQLIQEYKNTIYSPVITEDINSNSSYIPISALYNEFDTHITFDDIWNNSSRLNTSRFYFTNQNTTISI